MKPFGTVRPITFDMGDPGRTTGRRPADRGGQTQPAQGRGVMEQQQTDLPETSAAAHPIMFWVLTGLALAIFVPCTLVPVFLEGEQLCAYARTLEDQIGLLESRYERNHANAEALASDPLVNERIARRELNYRPEGERTIRWSAQDLASVRAVIPDSVALPVHPSAMVAPMPTRAGWVGSLHAWLPAWPYRDLFASEPQRTILLLMAGGLLLAAFLLYDPSPRSPTH
jgi:hypothetical protein